MYKIVVGFLLLMVFCVFLYGSYWIAKTVSYKLFYESMVESSITEMVKPECLKEE